VIVGRLRTQRALAEELEELGPFDDDELGIDPEEEADYE